MKGFNVLVLFVLFTMLGGCSQEDPKYNPLELEKMAKTVDPTIRPNFLAKDGLAALTGANKFCHQFQYGEGCQGVFRYTIQKLDVLLIEFENSDQARREAIRIGQFYARNWVFDDVRGEPGLEHFVRKVFKAECPAGSCQDESEKQEKEKQKN